MGSFSSDACTRSEDLTVVKRKTAKQTTLNFNFLKKKKKKKKPQKMASGFPQSLFQGSETTPVAIEIMKMSR